MAEVLDDLLGLPATLGAVDILEGRQCAPVDELGRPHHPIECPGLQDYKVVCVPRDIDGLMLVMH